MMEWLEIYQTKDGMPRMISLSSIDAIAPAPDGLGTLLRLRVAIFGGVRDIRVISPTYLELRDLLQPINVVR